MEPFLSSASDRSGVGIGPLDPHARSAVEALARSLEIFDPQASRRAALRAHLVDRIAQSADAPLQSRVDAITGAIVSEIGILLTHVRPAGTVDIVPDPTAAVLSATMLDRLPALAGTSEAVRHQFERWDGSGGPHGRRGPETPLAARLLAIAATLVGHPSPGQTPNWTTRRRRVEELLGSVLDPDLGTIVLAELESGEPFPSDVALSDVLAGLDRFVPPEADAPAEALSSVGAAIRAAGRMEDVLLVIADQARRALGATTVTISRIEPQTRRIETLVNAGVTGHYRLNEFHDETSRPGLHRVWEGDGFARSIDDGRADDQIIMSLHRRGLRSEVAAPVVVGDARWGVVSAETHAEGQPLDHTHLATLRLVASHIAAAVAQSERLAEFETLARHDPLTGLGNRRVLDERLAEIFQRTVAARQDVALIMCDVDGLKLVNDNHGHATGDALLIAAGEALSKAAATVTNSTTCRIGGDEFCIILDGGGLLSADPVTQRAMELFAAGGPNRSLSCGIALAGPEIANPGDFLRAADLAQYEQKRRRKGPPPRRQQTNDLERRQTRGRD